MASGVVSMHASLSATCDILARRRPGADNEGGRGHSSDLVRAMSSTSRRTLGNVGTVVIVAGGGPPAEGAAGHLRGLAAEGAGGIAADSGLEHARALGLGVSEVVGDMDSVDPETLVAAEEAGVGIERHPAAKDATDLDLALDAALARRPRRIVVVTGAGDRLDHTLAVA